MNSPLGLIGLDRGAHLYQPRKMRTRPANTDRDPNLLTADAPLYSYRPWSCIWTFTRSGKSNAKLRVRFASVSVSRTPWII